MDHECAECGRGTPIKRRVADCDGGMSIERRTALKLALGVALGLEFAGTATAQNTDPKSIRPQPGDRLVFADGDRLGEPITIADIAPGGPQIPAFPIDPVSRLIRDGSRLNKVLLIRSDPQALDAETRRRAVEGIAAYSAICTHQGCEVTAWDAHMQALWCPCHDSKFDPREGARVVGGPAPKRLATLPLKAVDGALAVAAGFSGPVGFQTR